MVPCLPVSSYISDIITATFESQTITVSTSAPPSHVTLLIPFVNKPILGLTRRIGSQYVAGCRKLSSPSKFRPFACINMS